MAKWRGVTYTNLTTGRGTQKTAEDGTVNVISATDKITYITRIRFLEIAAPTNKYLVGFDVPTAVTT